MKASPTLFTRDGRTIVLCLFRIMLANNSFAQSTTDLLKLSNVLLPGEVLYIGGEIPSNDGGHVLRMQTDGNLVLYNISNGQTTATWSTGTTGQTVALLAMQADGNLVLYRNDWQPIWAANRPVSMGAYLKVQNDGNLVIYPKNVDPSLADNQTYGAVWSSNTYGR